MKASLSNDVSGDILIVDDDLNNLQVLSIMLTARGYDVRGTRNGTAALDFIENDQPDLVLPDVHMPDMDAYEVCKRLKEDRRHEDVPVIFLSALQAADDRVRGFDAGAVDFISKPFQTEEVLARVRTHVTLRHLQRDLKQEVEARTTALKESETRYRSMIEASPVSVMTISKDFFNFVNPAGCQMLGFSDPEEIVGMPAMNIVAPESQPIIAERIRRLEIGKHNPLAEAVLVRKDGVKITVESLSVSVHINGMITAIIFAYKISDRKEMEIKLRKNEARLKAFMDHYPANIYIKDQSLRHVYGNKNLLESVGTRSQAWIGTTSHDFFPPDVAETKEEEDRAIIAARSPHLALATIYAIINGSVYA